MGPWCVGALARISRKTPSRFEGNGARFFELACEQDLEGIICEPKTSTYPFAWIKVKSRNDSQAVGPSEVFDRLLSEP